MTTGIVIASPASGAGKTTIMLGLLRAMKNRGAQVRPAKSGPDYIDPGYHHSAAGTHCVNLDAWAMPPERLLRLAANEGMLLVEGAMGLFDGAPPNGKGSTADLAATLGLPVILVIDASGQSQSVAAVYRGFSTHRNDVNVAGVIFNRVSGTRHERLVKNALERAGAVVFGAVHRDERIGLASRHLGLKQAMEHAGLEDLIEEIATVMESRVDIPAVIAAAGPITGLESGSCGQYGISPPAQRIAVASDVAFGFTYPHLLADWRRTGAEILPFSPLRDEAPSASAELVILPGGFPELHAGRLATASKFRRGVCAAKAVYGECGGYMVMGDGLVDGEGQRHAMLGLLRLETSFAGRKLHLGYRRLTALRGPFQGSFTGHEFHYTTTLKARGEPVFQVQDAEGVELPPAGLSNGVASGSFVHLIDRSSPETPQ
ncbi:MAG: cobyrinate a,c-diamide synthase [Gammaproteobacteria bacterium]|nr:cobyrinate a,c-diamide synthase [Gammaproteobacteria bacterium]